MASPQRGLVPLHFGAAFQQSSASAMQDAHNLFEQAIHLVNVLVTVTGKTTKEVRIGHFPCYLSCL